MNTFCQKNLKIILKHIVTLLSPCALFSRYFDTVYSDAINNTKLVKFVNKFDIDRSFFDNCDFTHDEFSGTEIK